VSEPLYKVKGEFFKTLGHPARIRVLELLVAGDKSVAELLPEVGLESSNLSQQLGVLRRAGVVDAQRDGNTMIYSIASPDIAELLLVARKVLTGVLSDRVAVLEDLRAAARSDVHGVDRQSLQDRSDRRARGTCTPTVDETSCRSAWFASDPAHRRGFVQWM
jgi:ArsR family transcriptional regulator